MKGFSLLFFIFIYYICAQIPLSAAVFQTDTLRVLAIRVEFQEDDSPTTTGNGKFDLSQSSDVYRIDPPPHDRNYFLDHLEYLKNYFWKISRETLLLNGSVFPTTDTAAYQLPEPMTSYNPNRTPEENNTALARLFRDAIQIADADSDITFSQYQSVIIFHAGVGKDVDLGFDETPQDIPSLFISSAFLEKYLGQGFIEVDDGQTRIKDGIIAPETESQGGIELGLNGILTSNFGSQLGWPDLFSPDTRRTGIGRFGLMDAGLFNGDGLLPALASAWVRVQAGFDRPIDLYYASNDEFTIYQPLSPEPERVYRIPIHEKEYFLIENRYAGALNFDSLQVAMSQGRPDFPNAKEVLLTHFSDQVRFSPRGVLIDIENPDIGLPGSGCLIWHIDERIIEENREANRINADPDRRGVDLEEADGSEDIGQLYNILNAGFGSELGWILDMWYSGNSSPLFENRFTPDSRPNSRSNDFRANSHVRVSEFSSPGQQMTFRLNLNIHQVNFPRYINRQTYGQVRSMKTADLDRDGKGDLIMTTDRGEMLVVNHTGKSPWTEDSLSVISLARGPVNPVVFFNNPLSRPVPSKGMVALTPDGTAWGFSFFENQQIDSLFSPIYTNSPISTHPLASYQADSSVTVYWGTKSGLVYQLILNTNSVFLDSVLNVQETVEYLHLNEAKDLIVVSSSGRVYRMEEFIDEQPLPYFSPAGDQATGLTRDGKILLYEQKDLPIAVDEVFRFDSPMIVNPFDNENPEAPRFFVSGDNRLYAFNYNFTLSSDFPVKILLPDQKNELPASPLFNRFFTEGLQETNGILITDSKGIIKGFDLKARRLADFPLSSGDSIQISPVVLDIDGDTDLEIAAINCMGYLYVWDLASKYVEYGWNQLYYDELNSNRISDLSGQNLPPVTEPLASNELMPENRVYNWPNPNVEQFTFIRYFLTESAQVQIKIFDMAGDLVEILNGTGNPQTDNEVRWNLSQVQNGIYLARLQAENESKKEIRFIKIAVIK